MRRTPPPKSRVPAEKVRVIVHAPEQRRDDEPPGYSAHQGGSFAEAGYTAGRGSFGFRQTVVT